jgi:ComF family protein
MLRTALAPMRPAAWPSQCEICRQWSEAGTPAACTAALCADCTTRFAASRPRCGRCGVRLAGDAPACGECLRDPPPFERTLCAVDYAFPWDALVVDFKFHGRVELAFALAALMTSTVRAAAGPLPQWVLPVPLAAPRLAERGYNQAWELARTMARALGLRADAKLLLRHGGGAHQADLGRAERQRNLRSAFMVEPQRRGELQGRRVALVDDVMTTGATAREAAAVLLRAGAAAVDVWVLARTPQE